MMDLKQTHDFILPERKRNALLSKGLPTNTAQLFHKLPLVPFSLHLERVWEGLDMDGERRKRWVYLLTKIHTRRHGNRNLTDK